MGKKADAIKIVDAQTGEYYVVTRETVGFDDGLSVGLEVTLRHGKENQPRVIEYPKTTSEARQQMVSLIGVAGGWLLDHTGGHSSP